MYVIFQNPGVIDRTSVTTLGVNSKENENPIGYFGTGLKYAIAILLREQQSITIYAGARKWDFKIKKEKVRNDTFDIVTLNNTKLGFTTELGKNWEVWQAFRELYCNTLDEGGTVTVSNLPTIDNLTGKTTIVVKGDKFLDSYYNKDNIVLNSVALFSNHSCEIHDKPSNHIYYRGIQAMKLPVQSKYTYNIVSKQELTEDRTIKSSWGVSSIVAKAIEECENTTILENTLLHSSGSYEEELSYEYGLDANKVFLDFCLENRVKLNPKLSYSITCRLKKCLPDISEIYTLHSLTNIEEKVLHKSINFLLVLSYDVKEYEIKVVTDLGDNILGLAKDNTIYIARRTFMMGTKMVAGTILEEYLHLKHGLCDESRDMQNYLFDLIVSLGERVIGEPL